MLLAPKLPAETRARLAAELEGTVYALAPPLAAPSTTRATRRATHIYTQWNITGVLESAARLSLVVVPETGPLEDDFCP